MIIAKTTFQSEDGNLKLLWTHKTIEQLYHLINSANELIVLVSNASYPESIARGYLEKYDLYQETGVLRICSIPGFIRDFEKLKPLKIKFLVLDHSIHEDEIDKITSRVQYPFYLYRAL